jgi:DNA-binding GntR family transcriptional regulator
MPAPGTAAPRPAPPRLLLQDRAYDRIKTLIQDGTYPPGTFLSERKLSHDLGMSKTPIRAALTRLDLEGFVSVSPQQGIVVRETSIHEIVDMFDIRAALESFVVRSLAGRLTDAQAARLRQNVRDQAESARAADDVELTRLDTEFHLMLCEFLDNREILRVMLHLRDKLHRVILRVNQASGRLQDASREHAGIAEAVLRGKGELAAERVREHLEFGKRFLVSR